MQHSPKQKDTSLQVIYKPRARLRGDVHAVTPTLVFTAVPVKDARQW